MSNADIGYNITVEVATDETATAWIELEEVYEIGLPDPQTDEIDATHLKSPNRTREFIAGLIDPGEATLGMNWVDGSVTDTTMVGLKATGETRAFRVTFANGTIWTYDAFVKSYSPSVPTGEKMTATAGLRVTGSISIS